MSSPAVVLWTVEPLGSVIFSVVSQSSPRFITRPSWRSFRRAPRTLFGKIPVSAAISAGDLPLTEF